MTNFIYLLIEIFIIAALVKNLGMIKYLARYNLFEETI